MAKRQQRPRSRLPKQTVHPEFGAYHRIIDRPPEEGEERQEVLRTFFGTVDELLRRIMPPVEVTDSRGKALRFKKQFKVYDDLDRTSISVFQRRVSRDYAARHHIKWTRRDVGRINGKVEDAIGRLDLGCVPLDVELTQVVRPARDGNAERSKFLALIPDQASPVTDLLIEEHALTLRGIKSSHLKQLVYPFSPFIPHMPIVAFHSDTTAEQRGEAVESVQGLLPLPVRLEPISFVSQQDIR